MKAVNRRSLVAAALLALALLWWSGRGDHAKPPAPSVSNAAPTPFTPIRRMADGSWGRSIVAPRRFGGDGLVHVRGKVVDAHDGSAVGGVDVVFSGASGETETTAN